MVEMGSDGFRCDWFKLVQMSLDGFRWVQMGSDGFRRVQIGSDVMGSKGLLMFQMGSD